MANELGLRNVAFEVDDLQAVVDRVAGDGYGLVGGIGQYEHIWAHGLRARTGGDHRVAGRAHRLTPPSMRDQPNVRRRAAPAFPHSEPYSVSSTGLNECERWPRRPPQDVTPPPDESTEACDVSQMTAGSPEQAAQPGWGPTANLSGVRRLIERRSLAVHLRDRRDRDCGSSGRGRRRREGGLDYGGTVGQHIRCGC
jgi:hypothetical protein